VIRLLLAVFFLCFSQLTGLALAQEAGAGEAAPPAEPVLAQIRFTGLKKEAESEVRALMRAREMEPYPESSQNRDLGVLVNSGKFRFVSMSRVQLSESAFRLDVNLTEGAPLPPPAADDDAIPSPPWVIGELSVEGNRHVKRKTIRAQIKGRKGDLYERTDLDRDIRAVEGLGSFERVAADITVLRDRYVPPHFSAASPSAHPIHLTFLVEERPEVREIRFEGRKKMSKGRLLDAIDMKRRDPFDAVKLRGDTAKVLEAYRKKGYHRASVQSAVEVDTAAHKADVVFTVFEGPRAKIRRIGIAGQTLYKKDKKLAGKAKLENRYKKVFDPAKLAEDRKKLEEFYKNRGFLDVEVGASSVTVGTDGTEIYVDWELLEGKQYRYGETSFSGHTLYASTDLAKALEYRRGKFFNQEKFDLSMHSIQELYAEKGRLRARVTPERAFNPDTGLMDVHFIVTEGPPVYVDHVDVEGFKATKGYVFKRELVIRPGMMFQVSKIRKSQERIFNLGFIDDIRLDVQSPYDPDKVDLTFEVFEGKPGMLTAGAGFSSLDGLIGTFSLQHLNLFGRAWQTKASWSFGSRVNDFSVSWTTPWVADRPISLGFDIFNTRRISTFEGASNAFTNRRTGGTVRVGPRFQDDKYHVNFRYSFQMIETLDVLEEFRDVLSAGTSVQSSVGVEVARDTRDNIWDPTRGSRNSLGATLAGGPVQGDIHFFKPSMSNSYHKALFHVGDYPFVFTAANRAGYVTHFGDSRSVPVFERYFIGGQDTLRGYSAVGEAGYRDGAKVFDVFNIEFGFPLARERRRTIVKFVTFFDAGGAWDTVRSMQMQVGKGEHHIKTDVGFGIRFTTPAFPIRLDWGYGFQHRPGESKYQINFGIGNLF